MKKIVFVCNMNQNIGSTHIHRCLALADYLRRKIHMNATFITSKEGVPVIQKKNFKALIRRGDLLKQILLEEPNIVVFDQLHTKKRVIDLLKKIYVPTMNLCCFDGNRSFCDVSISSITTDDWNAPGHYEGTNYTIVAREYLAGHPKIKRRIKKVFVYVKHKEAYEKINKILSGNDFQVTYVTHKKYAGIKDRVDYSENVAEILKSHDLSIVPMDLMLFQSLAAGIPTIIFANDNTEADKAKRFIDSNAALYMGYYKKVKINEARKMIRDINLGIAHRKRLQYVSRGLVNTGTCENVYKVFKQLVGI